MLNASLHVLVTIVDRGKGDGVASLLRQEGVLLHYIALGNGTAHKGILSLLGLKDTAKDVVFSFIRSGVARRAMRRLSYALEIDLPGRGIAFTIPVGSIGGSQAMHYLMGEEMPAAHDEGGNTVEQEQIKNEVIIAIVNRGYTDLVMESALPAGARGGTVLHARGAGTEEASQFFGITIQPEKEMVMILVDREHKVPVMQAITRGAGLSTEGHGIIFSLPVTDVMGIRRLTEESAEEEE
ncbi:MAG: P-II family nitrogen regulator [Clostridia bacterium]|nr:P-II family nitrogen regulator [Clostridia bacterium]